MAEFIYYLPGITTDIGKAFDASGLSDRLQSVAHALIDLGPGKQPGAMINRSGHGLRYKPDEQTWAGPFNDGAYWIGFCNDRHPGAADLARPEKIAGTAVTLLDGNDWLIPAWRMAPMALTMTPGGEVVQTALPVTERLQGCVKQIATIFGDDTKADVDLIELLRIIADVLAVNYRMGTDPAQEPTLLALVSTANVQAAVNAVLDVDHLETVGAEQRFQ